MRKIHGFTLIELVMVILLFSIISVVAATLIAQSFNGYLTSKNIVDANWQARLAFERMTLDVRQAQSISTASASQLTFTDTSNNTITYQLSGSNLTRNGNILADGIQTLIFSYYASDGSTTSTPAAIRYIQYSLTITKNNTNYVATTAVNPRNLL